LCQIGDSLPRPRIDDLQTQACKVPAVARDHAKFKTAFGKGKMLPMYLDHSLQAFDEVLPAAGSVNSAVRISPALMAQVTGGVWVDACK